MKILEYIRYYSLQILEDIYLQSHDMPLHQLWNWEYLKASGYQVEEVVPCPLVQQGILRRLLMDNYEQQKQVSKTDADIVYAPFCGDAYYLAFLRSIGLFKKPIIAISQDTWSPSFSNSFINKLKLLFIRYIAKHGIDKLLFISSGVYDQCKHYFNNEKNHIVLNHWGVDVEYYDNYIRKQKESPSNDYIFVTGGANRDFDLIQRLGASNDLAKPFLIQTNRCPDYLTENVNLKIDRTPNTWNDLLAGYYNSAAVAIPLKQRLSYLSGITVVLEGMACSKPVLSTETNLYPFDIEKEKVGFFLPYGDEQAWKEAVLYIKDNPEDAAEMGNRGRFIVEHKHNYKKFCSELNEVIQNIQPL